MNSQTQIPGLSQDDYGKALQLEFQGRRSEFESQLEVLSVESEEYRSVFGELVRLEEEHRKLLTGIAYCLR